MVRLVSIFCLLSGTGNGETGQTVGQTVGSSADFANRRSQAIRQPLPHDSPAVIKSNGATRNFGSPLAKLAVFKAAGNASNCDPLRICDTSKALLPLRRTGFVTYHPSENSSLPGESLVYGYLVFLTPTLRVVF